MQVKKDDILEKIVKSAEGEFFEKSYANTSLNKIAKNAGVSRGAIYTYFKNKDDLYSYLCKDAVDLFKNNLSIKDSFYEVIVSEEIMRIGFKNFADELKEIHISVRLLLFCAGGSKYENFAEEIILMYYKAFPMWALGINDYEKAYKSVANDMIIHTIAKMYIFYIEEIILHEPTEEELSEYVDGLVKWVYAGVEQLREHFKKFRSTE